VKALLIKWLLLNLRTAINDSHGNDYIMYSVLVSCNGIMMGNNMVHQKMGFRNEGISNLSSVLGQQV